MASVYVIGDIHGQITKLKNLLKSAGLIDQRGCWSGGQSVLCFVGDFVDRGSDSIGVIDLVMHLQHEAAESGGEVKAVMGNHDPMMLAAYYFPRVLTRDGVNFIFQWIRNGGSAPELDRLTEAHINWIKNLPAMLHIGNRLIVHADSLIYRDYGDTVESVNRAFSDILHSGNPAEWDILIERFVEREAYTQDDGIQLAENMLAQYGGKQIVHGHTPISKVTGEHPAKVTSPFIYANGLCVNVDGGMYRGSPGFIYKLANV
jgi:hypothetical protein